VAPGPGPPEGPRSHDVSGFTQPIRPADEQKVRAFLLARPGVTAIRQILVTFLGPNRVWLVVRLNIDDDLHGAQVKALARDIESGLKQQSQSY
jgi:divalent metal cation (Fe/Co/Zn/Cd) transporter